VDKDKDNIKKEDKVKIRRDRTGHTYFWCACNGHMITLWWDEEYEFDLVELSFWDNPGNYYGWKQKLAHIWRIIKCGSPYADHISLDADECDLFIETLQFYAVKARGAKEKAEKKLAAYQLKYRDDELKKKLKKELTKEEKVKSAPNLSGITTTPFTPKPGVAARYVQDAHFGESDECDCDQCIPEK